MSENKTTIPPAVNAGMRFILRSPLHGMVSKTITLISFTGRTSGKVIPRRSATHKSAAR